MGEVGTIAEFDGQGPDAEGGIDGRLQILNHLDGSGRPEATVGRIRPAAGAPLLLISRRRLSGAGAGVSLLLDEHGVRLRDHIVVRRDCR